MIPIGAMPMEYTLNADNIPEPSNTQGVSGWQRFLVKNFASSPEQMENWLRSMGYEARRYRGKGGFNFSVRKSKDDMWQVVDPAGFDSQDIFDILTDLGQGLVTGTVGGAAAVGGGFVGGALGGPVGAVVGAVGAGAPAAGFAGGATEYLRQRAGTLLGAPDNLDLEAIKHEAIVSGLMQAALPVAGAAFRGAGRAARFVGREYLAPVGAAVARFKSTVGLPGGEALLGRAAIKAATMRNKAHAATVLSNLVRRTSKARFPEYTLAQDLARASGASVDASGVKSELLDLTLQSVGQRASTTTKHIITEAEYVTERTMQRQGASARLNKEGELVVRGRGPVATSESVGGPDADLAMGLGVPESSSARTLRDATTTRTSMDEAFEATTDALAARLISEPSLANSIANTLELVDTYAQRTAGTSDWSKLPIDALSTIHDQLRKIARKGKALTGAPVNDSYIQAITKAQHDINVLIHDAMKQTDVYFPWRQARVKVMGKASSLEDFRTAIFGAGHLTRAEINARAESLVSSWGSNDPTHTRHMIHQWIKRFGAESFEPSRRAIYEANIAEAVGAGGGGVGALTRKPTITSVGTVLGGSALSTVLGMGPTLGAAGGLALGNPAGIVGLARLAQRTDRIMTGALSNPATPFVEGTARAIGFGVAQEGAREQPRRRANLTGGY
jgi:hypothetical protein